MFSPQRKVSFILLFIVTFTATPSHAMFGEENLFLAEIAATLSQQMSQLRQTARDVRRNVVYARESAAWAHDALQVAKNVHYLKKHPDLLVAQSRARFAQSFPEGQGLLLESHKFVQELKALGRHASDPDYDAYAYAATLAGLQRAEAFRYELLVRNLDTLGVHEVHDAALQELREQHDVASHNLAELQGQLQTVGLTPARAPLFTARATSVGAAAQVRAAATLQALKRDSEITFVENERVRRAAAAAWLQQQESLRRVHHSWRLTPLGEAEDRTP